MLIVDVQFLVLLLAGSFLLVRMKLRSSEGMEAVCKNEEKYDKFYRLCGIKE